ncbi:MAG: hypothetical protein L0177_14950 [Chloroflexi bacterium]|nr:hypothetical protein [Chloroflexota bacterium]
MVSFPGDISFSGQLLNRMMEMQSRQDDIQNSLDILGDELQDLDERVTDVEILKLQDQLNVLNDALRSHMSFFDSFQSMVIFQWLKGLQIEFATSLIMKLSLGLISAAEMNDAVRTLTEYSKESIQEPKSASESWQALTSYVQKVTGNRDLWQKLF